MNNFTLTIDRGNTQTKCALFGSHSNLLISFPYNKLQSTIQNFGLSYENTKAIISCVSGESDFFEGSISTKFKTLNAKELFKKNHFLKMPVHYSETLGIDRLAIAYYAYQKDHFSKLLIDAGTFTTVDQVDLKGFNGGFILPGLTLIADSYSKGQNLFQATTKTISHLNEFISQFPQSTPMAINMGSLLTFLSPIQQIIRSHQPQNILITGGHGEFLENYLKKWAHCQDASIQFIPDLIHIGLYQILQEYEK